MEALLSDMIRLESYKATEGATVPLSVVVADDERRIVHLLTVTLKSIGHEVIASADNGEDAVELVLKRRPDLVILDIDMPKMDGLTAAAKILAEAHLPIILSTGRSDIETLQRAKKLEIQAYLVKPFSRAQLLSTISVALAQHQTLLAARVKIAALTSQIELVKTVDIAVSLMTDKFRIDRKEALEKMETAARVRCCTLADAAKSMIVALSPRPEAAAVAENP